MNSQNTIHALFEEWVERTPYHTALLFNGQSMTYWELNKRANQFAHYLRALGVNPDTQIALCMERSIDLFIVIFGILKAGAAYLPLDSSHPEERLLFILKDSQTSFIVTHSELKEKFVSYQGKLIAFEAFARETGGYDEANPSPIAESHHLAYIIYTSGSTGNPKGVLIEHKSVINYCRWFTAYTEYQSCQRVDFSLNYIFDMAISVTLVPLMSGMTVVIGSDQIKKNISVYLDYLKDNKINSIKITPTYLKVMLRELKFRQVSLPDLRILILGGENLSSSDCLAWLDLYPEHTLFNEYGPTEATVGISLYKVNRANCSLLPTHVPIGRPGSNVYCHILDSNLSPVSPGEQGELYIGGICLARGYLNRPDLTQRQFISDPFSENNMARLYKTGDLCRELPDGSMECIGRIDHQVKVRGFRVEPGEIEKRLLSHQAIADVIVIAQEDSLKEKLLVAYYILKDDKAEQPINSQLRHYLQILLPDYMIPSFFIKVEAFPLTPNGKLDRNALPVPELTLTRDYLKPRTALEKKLARIWSEELDIKRIGLNDNFFELGGHSLCAARIISKINNNLGKVITLDEFYHALTIRELTGVVSRARKKNALHKVEYEASSSWLPLSDFQLLLWLSSTFEPKAKKLNVVARKRLQGQLDLETLKRALDAVFKQHPILFCKVLTCQPAQVLQTNLPFKIITKNLETLSDSECSQVLETSVKELRAHTAWARGKPKLIIRLFYMKEDSIELQACMPHIIADDVSPDILFSHLSDYYLLDTRLTLDEVNPDQHYREYLLNEQRYSQMYLDRDFDFWSKYLKDAHLFTFPGSAIVKKTTSPHFAYSTYMEIPENTLINLQQFCVRNNVSLNDGLCASVALALGDYSGSKEHVFITLVKSTRDSQTYDNTIGCFLRLEPIKITLNKYSTLTDLAQQIHQAVIETNFYQRCSNVVKLACINVFSQKKRIKSCLISLLVYLYTVIFPGLKLNRKIFNLCGRLRSFEGTDKFPVFINVQSNFLTSKKQNRDLFGLKSKKIEFYQYDLLKINNFLDVSFLRDDNHHTPYLVLSANLGPDFRELIAKKVFYILNSLTVNQKKEERKSDFII